MARKVRTALIAVVASILLLNSICNHLFHHPPSITAQDLLAPPLPLSLQTNPNLAISEHEQLDQDQEEEVSYKNSRHVTSVRESIPTLSILLPAWEILVILSPETPRPQSDGDVACLFPNNDSSTAVPAGFLSSPYRQTFKCDFPMRLRRRFPFPQPILTSFSPGEKTPAEIKSPAPELLRWNFLVYDSITTDTDVVFFVKGLNHRQGSSRSPTDFACVFGDDVINGVKTAVTSAVQEVFRCQIPKLTAVLPPSKIKISLEVLEQNRVVPSVAHYTPPPRKIATNQPKSQICACTMVYNVAKFLKEWVIYHSAIGVERFILYDNASEDDLDRVVEELIQSGYNVTTAFWIWPKTQEAGFSHCAIRAKDSCEWVAYIDVDEFIYSQSWLSSLNPSRNMLQSLLPKSEEEEEESIGQVLIGCYEFGPSNQKSNPRNGVIQGYNCRQREENRHKSVVRLDAIDDSLLNVIHHFRLKQGYKGKKLRIEDAAVNHYKYQAWVEFKTKFRRRVSAYVADWTQAVNPASKDRTPGLGYAPVEPHGWAGRFCEVYDNRLRDLIRRWFGIGLSYGVPRWIGRELN